MDIAGTAWTKGERPTGPRFATGFGVRILNHWISSTQE
jgi:leucyl aminopeptidase